MTAKTAPELPADLVAALRRLKLSTMRQLAPELLLTAKTAPELPADLVAALRRLKLSTMRQLAPELLLTAKTQRWAPEEVLRTLVEAEVASRDASNATARLKAATFPVVKTVEEFDVSVSSIPPPTC